MILLLWLILVQYLKVVGLLQLGFESSLLIGILALAKMSWMDFSFLNVTIMSLLTSGLVALDWSNMDQYLHIISFKGIAPIICGDHHKGMFFFLLHWWVQK